ncbi:hypothetical protein PROFUN_03817 [Planoprotostelium fungivorum]|uniref:PAS domain-containing protein n=1 Tax=Planoprotostelium fungivorum TaxID=1890364 RepID=A0A2P6NIA1_9EUKA|nr:hypothetical protein PROFUN_03817 [Planoprotostelium fungivorum]
MVTKTLSERMAEQMEVLDTEEMRRRIDVGCKLHDLMITFRQVQMKKNDEIPIPCVLFNAFSQVVHANPAFYKLTGMPCQPHELSQEDTSYLFDYTPLAVRQKMWMHQTDQNEIVLPCYLRVWKTESCKREQRHGRDYIEATKWMMVDMDLVKEKKVKYMFNVYVMPSASALN